MKKLLFFVLLIPSISFADRLGSLKPSSDVALSTQAVLVNLSSSPVNLSSGSVIYVSPMNTLTGNTTHLFYDPINNFLGVGLSTPIATIHTFSHLPGNSMFFETDDPGSEGPTIVLQHSSPSPAVNDANAIVSHAKSSTGATRIYSDISFLIRDTTNTQERGATWLSNIYKGSIVSSLKLDPLETFFNADGVITDFRVASSSSTSSFFMKGSNGKIGISTDTPNARFEIFGTRDEKQLKITPLAGQSATAFEVSRSTTVYASIDSTGNAVFQNFYVVGGTVATTLYMVTGSSVVFGSDGTTYKITRDGTSMKIFAGNSAACIQFDGSSGSYNLMPCLDGFQDLGSASFQWRNLKAQNWTAGNGSVQFPTINFQNNTSEGFWSPSATSVGLSLGNVRTIDWIHQGGGTLPKLIHYYNNSSIQDRPVGVDSFGWSDATDATRKGRRIFSVVDTSTRTAIQIDTDGSNAYTTIIGSVTVSTMVVTGSIVWPNGTVQVSSPTSGGSATSSISTLYTSTQAFIINNTAAVSTICWNTGGIGSRTIGANTLISGKTIRIYAIGISSSSGTPNNLTVAVKLGTTTMVSGTATLTGITNGKLVITALITCYTSGAGGTVEAQGEILQSLSSGAAAPTDYINVGNVNPITLDTTVSQDVNVTLSWSVGATNAGNRISNFTIESLN